MRGRGSTTGRKRDNKVTVYTSGPTWKPAEISIPTKARTIDQLNARLLKIIKRYRSNFKSITADNGTEFHGHRSIEHKTGIKFYSATPYHSWELGTNENTNGLIRQYLPKSESMASVSQQQRNAIAAKLNTRPRKTPGFFTPEECVYA